jgi:hypothetical protein
MKFLFIVLCLLVLASCGSINAATDNAGEWMQDTIIDVGHEIEDSDIGQALDNAGQDVEDGLNELGEDIEAGPQE